MEINPINEMTNSGDIEMLQLRGGQRKCVYYKEEVCSAPKLRFDICRVCYRIDIRSAGKNLFDKIINMAAKLFNLQASESEQPPPEE
jgi:hypothetical protein